MLNPGFSEQDLVDQADPMFRGAVGRALTLQPTARFWQLLPELANTSAARWWRPRLAPLIAALGTGGEEIVRTRLSDIEYFPYHSVNWRSPPRLPSQDAGFALVQSAMDRGVTIVVMRGWERWTAAVHGLSSYASVFRNLHPRQATVSRGNLGDKTFDTLVRAIATS